MVVSSKVKSLDQARALVQQTQKKVSDIIEVKSCLENVNAAIASQNWEKACKFISTFLSVDRSMLEPTYTSLMIISSIHNLVIGV